MEWGIKQNTDTGPNHQQEVSCFIAGVRESGSHVGQADKGTLTSTNYSAGKQAPDRYEQGTDERCGDEGKQAAVSRRYKVACLVL